MYDPTEHPSHADAIALVHQALDQGVNISNTAYTYCRHGTEVHYCVRPLAEALGTCPGQKRAKQALVLTR